MSDRNYWTSLRQRKISRRTMLGASAKAGVGAAGLALVGCGDDDDDAAPAAVDTSAIDAAAGDASAAASAAGEASAAASEASAAASEAAAAASQAADAAAAAAALAAEAAESEDAANAAAAAEAAAAAAAQAADAASAAGDAAAAAVADAAAEDTAAAAAAAQAAAEAAAAAATAAEDAAQAAREAVEAVAAVGADMAEDAEFSVPWPLDQVDLDGSIVTGIPSRQEGTDHHRAGSQGNAYSHGAVFNAAMEIDPADASAIPSLATPEFIDPVTLRATVEPAPFHDGSILTAQDMVFSYDRAGGVAEYHQGGATTDHSGGWTPTNPTRGAESWARNEAVDDRTWSFELAGADGGFFAVNLARIGEVAIYSQADVLRRGDAAVDTVPMGTGPYRFVSQTADENSVFERFEDHFLPVDYPVTVSHYAHNKHLTVVVRPELQSRLAGLEAGEIDTLENLGPDVVEPFKDDPDFTVTFQKSAQPPMNNLFPNLFQQTMDDGSPNPFLDLRVRRAANYALNRQSMIDNLLLGLGEQAMFAFSGIGGYPTAEQKQEVLFDYDPERARALMAEAGYADGFDVPLYYQPETGGSFVPDMALAVEQDLNAVGIRAELRPIPSDQYFTDAYTRGRENAPPGIFWFYANTVPDVGSMWECCTGPDGFFTLSNPLDPSLDELYQTLKAEPDAARRTEMVTELLLEHARQAYFIFLLEAPSAVLTPADVNWPLGGPFGQLNGKTTFAAQRHA